jgi:Ni/Co efflux regulator RcnB
MKKILAALVAFTFVSAPALAAEEKKEVKKEEKKAEKKAEKKEEKKAEEKK